MAFMLDLPQSLGGELNSEPVKPAISQTCETVLFGATSGICESPRHSCYKTVESLDPREHGGALWCGCRQSLWPW